MVVDTNMKEREYDRETQEEADEEGRRGLADESNDPI